jgi:hypothetical protein
MNGDVALIQSRNDLTAFAFKLPIKLKSLTLQSKERDNSLHRRYSMTKLYGNDKRSINESIANYLEEKKIDF